MKEIKFRVWDKKENKMIYEGFFDYCNKEYYGSYADYYFLSLKLNGELVAFNIDSNEKDGLWEYRVDVKDRFIVMQYSGLCDKNGKEIYEGDIVKFYDDLFIVKFDDGGGEESGWGEGLVKFVGFYLEPIDVNNLAYYSSIYSLINSWHNIRGNVIGNIYENKELLEVKK